MSQNFFLLKIIAILTSLILMVLIIIMSRYPQFINSKAQSESYRCPDLNNDGSVNTIDINIIQNQIGKILNETNSEFAFSDIDKNLIINTRDVQLASQYLNKDINTIPSCFAPSPAFSQVSQKYRTINIKMNPHTNELFEFAFSNNSDFITTSESCGISEVEVGFGIDKKGTYSVDSGGVIRKTNDGSINDAIGDCVIGEEENGTTLCSNLETEWKEQITNKCQEGSCALLESHSTYRPKGDLSCGNDGYWHLCDESHAGELFFINEIPFKCINNQWKNLIVIQSNKWELNANNNLTILDNNIISLKKVLQEIPFVLSGYYTPTGVSTSGTYMNKVFVVKHYNDDDVKESVEFVYRFLDLPNEMKGTFGKLVPSYSQNSLSAYLNQYEYIYEEGVEGNKVLSQIIEKRKMRDGLESRIDQTDKSLYQLTQSIIEEKDLLQQKALEFDHRISSDSGKIIWTTTQSQEREFISFTEAIKNLNKTIEPGTLPKDGLIDNLQVLQNTIEIIRENARWIFDKNGVLISSFGTDPLQDVKRVETGSMWFTVEVGGQIRRVKLQRVKNADLNIYEWGFSYKDQNGQSQWSQLKKSSDLRNIKTQALLQQENSIIESKLLPDQKSIDIENGVEQNNMEVKQVKSIGISQKFYPISFTQENDKKITQSFRLDWEGEENGYILRYYDPRPGQDDSQNWKSTPESWPTGDILETLYQENQLILNEDQIDSPSQERAKDNNQGLTEDEIVGVLKEIRQSQERLEQQWIVYSASLIQAPKDEVYEALASIMIGNLEVGINLLNQIFEKKEKNATQALLYLAMYDVLQKDYKVALQKLFEIIQLAPESYEAQAARLLILKIDSFRFIEASQRYNKFALDQWESRLNDDKGFFAGEVAFESIKDNPLSVAKIILDTLNPIYFSIYMASKSRDFKDPLEVVRYNETTLSQGINLISQLINKGYAFDITSAINIIKQNGSAMVDGQPKNAFDELGIKTDPNKQWYDPATESLIDYNSAIIKALENDPLIKAGIISQNTILSDPDFINSLERQTALLESAKNYRNEANYLAASAIFEQLASSSFPTIAQEASDLYRDIKGEGQFNFADETLAFGIGEIVAENLNPIVWFAYGKLAEAGSSVIGMTRAGTQLLQVVQSGRIAGTSNVQKLFGNGDMGKAISLLVENGGQAILEYGADKIHPSLAWAVSILNGGAGLEYKVAKVMPVNKYKLTHVQIEGVNMSPILVVSKEDFNWMLNYVKSEKNQQIWNQWEESSSGVKVMNKNNESFFITSDESSISSLPNIFERNHLQDELWQLDIYQDLSEVMRKQSAVDQSLKNKAVDESPIFTYQPNLLDKLFGGPNPVQFRFYNENKSFIPGRRPIVLTHPSRQENMVIHFFKGSKLEFAYNEIKENITRVKLFTGQPLREEQILNTVFTYVQNATPHSRSFTDRFLDSPTGVKQSVDIGESCLFHAGVCRHQGAISAAFLGKMHTDNILSGKPKYKNGVGHAWAEYHSSDRNIYILDSAQRYFGPMNDSNRKYITNYIKDIDKEGFVLYADDEGNYRRYSDNSIQISASKKN